MLALQFGQGSVYIWLVSSTANDSKWINVFDSHWLGIEIQTNPEFKKNKKQKTLSIKYLKLSGSNIFATVKKKSQKEEKAH